MGVLDKIREQNLTSLAVRFVFVGVFDGISEKVLPHSPSSLLLLIISILLS